MTRRLDLVDPLRRVLHFRMLVVFLAISACAVAIMISRWLARIESRFAALARLECESAVAALESGGPEKLVSVTQRHEAESGVRAWLFEESDRPIGGGPSRAMLLARGPLLARLSSIMRGRHPSNAWATRQVGKYSCIVISDLGQPEISGIRSIQLLAFLSLLCCAAAAYVTARMRRLEAAIDRFGTGRLEVRVSPTAATRFIAYRRLSTRWRTGWNCFSPPTVACASMFRTSFVRR